MKHLKRLGVLCTAAALLFCCAGCTQSESSAAEPEISIAIPENVLGKPSQIIPEVSMDKYAVPEGEGLSFVKGLKLGWNLGNTFDASDANLSAENELDYEKAWCGVITKPETIAAIKGAGFNTIRVPVSWHNHVDAENRISEKWMARVKEVVDWCRACDLYVILNTHHDNDAKKGYYPDSAHLESSKTYLTAVWKQIAETFKDYDEHLILESLNEPRLAGTNLEWTFQANNPTCADSANVINTLNQLFVDTVRAAGGQNATRWLLCPGYAASPDGALNGFAMPTDPANRVIVSVHAYTPYNFALNAAGTKDFPLDQDFPKREINDFMDKLYGKFILKGVPVLIGEFGARNKDDNLQDRVNFAAYYVAAARARGITCVWWDNNAFTGSGENFGLLARRDNTVLYPDIVQAMVKYAE